MIRYSYIACLVVQSSLDTLGHLLRIKCPVTYTQSCIIDIIILWHDLKHVVRHCVWNHYETLRCIFRVRWQPHTMQWAKALDRLIWCLCSPRSLLSGGGGSHDPNHLQKYNVICLTVGYVCLCVCVCLFVCERDFVWRDVQESVVTAITWVLEDTCVMICGLKILYSFKVIYPTGLFFFPFWL